MAQAPAEDAVPAEETVAVAAETTEAPTA
ncbi:hypothetical protein BN11_450027 [Nostocoides australiense Ben110]|uniref:Uncharacterized protein n=1 Tax=Nostocoides australiense Ben110 TaxID=1193182 RepID=W6K468_9MICO|nr:hypothetical protein BN11_450027 [Tetrasphaera australiensis Ben110]